jgi:hypothetical protein
LDYATARIYGSQLSLVCYTNTANSLTLSSTYASLSKPTLGNGYAPILLDGTWTFTNGTVTYLKAGLNPLWTATGTWSAPVTGVAMVDLNTSTLLHFRDLSVAFVASNQRKLEVDVVNLVT